MRKIKKICGVLSFVLAAALLAGCGSSGGDVRFGAAATGGVYHKFSTEFSTVLENNGVGISAKETAGSAANLRLLSQGYIDLGLAQSDLISEMYFGEAYGLEQNYRGYSAIAELYPEYVQIVVRKDADIDSVDDLDGRSISIGQEESGTERDALQILSAYGLDSDNVTELNYDYADGMDHLLKGDIDLLFVTAGAPSEILEENAAEIKFISIDENKRRRIQSTFDGFESAVIPAGTYTGQDYDVDTISVSAVLLAADSLPTDTVYNITSALFENRESLGNAVSLELRDKDTALAGISIPVHPGAAAWYIDNGVTIGESGREVAERADD